MTIDRMIRRGIDRCVLVISGHFHRCLSIDNVCTSEFRYTAEKALILLNTLLSQYLVYCQQCVQRTYAPYEHVWLFRSVFFLVNLANWLASCSVVHAAIASAQLGFVEKAEGIENLEGSLFLVREDSLVYTIRVYRSARREKNVTKERKEKRKEKP